ncbi:hypothetical protein B0T21DRAFT_358586 [Apiosordaria backusii]|uniref:C2H2-type domain-containing protein n=1 Tax=Apiosordaria backusii TaxID=314023 RepID=A0AA40ESY0_9PEZI|nr:hypothetical protein B0T21DRAFT_358586 [Apiosordaria backusii]
MACDMLHLFDHEQACPEDSLVCGQLRGELRGLISLLQQQNSTVSTGCYLADLGNFLVKALYITSELARSMVKTQNIRGYTEDLATFLEQEPDLRSTEYLNGKHEALKKVCSQIRKLSESVVKIWGESPPIPQPLLDHLHGAPPEPSPSPEPEPEPFFSETTTLPFREQTSVPPGSSFTGPSMASSFGHGSWDITSVESSHVRHRNSTGSDDYDDNGQYVTVTSLQELTHRGRGVGPYVCPQKENCKKGGWGSDGRPRLFMRNSEFKAHLEKHEKRYKCDLPGCPKPGRGFARPDQLQRHKDTVAHRYEDYGGGEG